MCDCVKSFQLSRFVRNKKLIQLKNMKTLKCKEFDKNINYTITKKPSCLYDIHYK